jgi:hypothetical protein
MNGILNPLKLLKTVNQIKKKKNTNLRGDIHPKFDFQFRVELYPDYFDLSIGVWNVTLSQCLVRNLGNTKAFAVFDVKTSLATQFVRDPYNLQEPPSSKYVTLNTVGVGTGLPKNSFFLDSYNPQLWFTCDKAQPTCFILEYSQITSPKFDHNNEEYELEIESTFLFQRLK